MPRRNFKPLETPEKHRREPSNKNRDLRVKDFFKSMKRRELQLSLQEHRLLFRKHLLKPWKNKWHLL